MRTCENCGWAEIGVVLGIPDCLIGCQKDESQEWISGEVFPVEVPCASFVTSGEKGDV